MKVIKKRTDLNLPLGKLDSLTFKFRLRYETEILRMCLYCFGGSPSSDNRRYLKLGGQCHAPTQTEYTKQPLLTQLVLDAEGKTHLLLRISGIFEGISPIGPLALVALNIFVFKATSSQLIRRAFM